MQCKSRGKGPQSPSHPSERCFVSCFAYGVHACLFLHRRDRPEQRCSGLKFYFLFPLQSQKSVNYSLPSSFPRFVYPKGCIRREARLQAQLRSYILVLESRASTFPNQA